MHIYTIDASIAVKWLNQEEEGYVAQAFDILQKAVAKYHVLIAPDLILYEASNAVARGKGLSGEILEEAVHDLFAVPLRIIYPTQDLITYATQIATTYRMTIYDALYVAVADAHHVPLITDNAKDQARIGGNMVIDLKNWTI